MEGLHLDSAVAIRPPDGKTRMSMRGYERASEEQAVGMFPQSDNLIEQSHPVAIIIPSTHHADTNLDWILQEAHWPSPLALSRLQGSDPPSAVAIQRRQAPADPDAVGLCEILVGIFMKEMLKQFNYLWITLLFTSYLPFIHSNSLPHHRKNHSQLTHPNSTSSGKFRFETVTPPPGYEAWTSSVVLPSPPQGGQSDWSGAIERAKHFVSKLTIEEKVNLTTGSGTSGRCVGETGTIPRLGFDQPICLQDGPAGVRFAKGNSVFSAGINAASTFDKELIYARARAMGLEFRNKGVNVALAPMTNLMRAPTSGRAWEGCGADPYLCGVTTAQSVLGIQSTQVSACIKHYIGNEQEHYRGGSGSIASSSNIDDQTL
ncbi:hypothetical protein O181_095589, partial [Austropuccinia psidii MF-1]|nr:hypothetical protein [Austropuccinia psidii MF-1]